MNRFLAILLTMTLLVGPLAGCLKGGDDEPVQDVEQAKVNAILGTEGKDKIQDLAALIPKNYSFPGQELLPQVEIRIAGKATSEALGSYEAQRDEGGIEYRTVLIMEDISQYLPAGQPTEMFVKLFWDGSEANSADLDIAIDVPGTKTSLSNVTEDLNWNYASKSTTVNTIGVAGEKHEVGVQIAGGAVSEGFEYELVLRFTYVKDVLTPYHPWAFNVPPGASGIVLEADKVTGDEHLMSDFIILDPNDQLVSYVAFNDIDIPTESVFVPTNGPGEYVFYSAYMHGGFLRLKADVPLEKFDVRPLTRVLTETIDLAGPAPGIAGKDYLEGGAGSGAIPTSDTNAITVNFDSGSSFPLEVKGFIRGQINTMAKITLESPLGEVHRLTSVARYQDDSGSIGYTGEEEGEANNKLTWKNIQRGSWTATIVNDGPAEVGHTLLTYTR